MLANGREALLPLVRLNSYGPLIGLWRDMLAASPQGEGDWITHDGGPNPVPGKKADVRFPDGTEDFGFSSEYWSGGDCDWWRHESDNPSQHIIAYRVTEGVKP